MEYITDANGLTVHCADNLSHVIDNCELCNSENVRCIKVDNKNSSKICIYCAQRITLIILNSMYALHVKCNDGYEDFCTQKRRERGELV